MCVKTDTKNRTSSPIEITNKMRMCSRIHYSIVS